MVKFLRILSAILLLSGGALLFTDYNLIGSFCMILSSVCLLINEQLNRKNSQRNEIL